MNELSQLLIPVLTERQITALTGGGAGKLDGIITVGLALSPVPRIEFIIGTTLSVYYLVSGTDAEASPGIIRPDDYATTTNEKVWKLISFIGGAVSTSRQILTTAPVLGGGDLASDRTISMHVADSTHDGYLSSTDWSTFDGYGVLISTNSSNIATLSGAIGSLSGLIALNALAATTITPSAPLVGGGSLAANRTLSITLADASHDGYLSQTDWGTFNAKQAALGFTPVTNARTISTTAPLTGGGALTGNLTIAMHVADASNDGYLSTTDWTAFNAKFASTGGAISGDTAITGRITSDNVTVTQATIAYASTTDIDFSSASDKTITLTGDIILTSSNRGAGKKMHVRIIGDSVDRAITFPGWIFLGLAQPATVPANSRMFLTLDCYGTLSGQVLATCICSTTVVATDSLSGQMSSADHTSLTNLKKISIPFIIDGGGATITAGSKGLIRVPAAMTITGWEMFADASGSIVVDVKKATYAGLPTTASITASALPTLTSAQKNTDTTLTGWTTAVASGDWLEFTVNSATTVQRVTLAIFGTRT